MKKTIIISVILAVLFFAGTAAYGMNAPKILNSPDETSVAFFSRTLALDGRLWAYDGLNVAVGDAIHPRSIISIDAALVPASFYGAMLVIGVLMMLAGPIALSATTPLFTALAGMCFYFFLRKRSELAGLIGQAIFYLTPAVWYYASRGLFPNLLFCDLALIGAATLYFHPVLAFARGRGNAALERTIDALVGGFLVGLAFAVRPVEFIWLAPLGAAALWFARKKFRWYEIIPAVISFGVMLVIIFSTNNGLYGAPFSFGYTAGATTPGIAVPALGAASRLPAWLSEPRPFILPFGFHPMLALANLYDYLILFAPWFALFAVWGLVALALQKRSRRYFKFLLLAFIWMFLVLGIYYGSGIFNDSTAPGLTPGSSYVRYFLPLYLVLVPAVAEGIVAFIRYAKKRTILGRMVACSIVVCFAVFGAWTVYFRAPESLAPMLKTLSHYADVKQQVLEIVKPTDVIITERSDKVFFPDRRVLLNLRDSETMKVLPKLNVGLYYYGIAVSEEEYAKLEAELGKYGLQMGRIKAFGNEMLYGITRVPKT